MDSAIKSNNFTKNYFILVLIWFIVTLENGISQNSTDVI